MTPGEDELRLDGIAFRAIIGVTERERRSPRRLVVNLRVALDLRRVRSSDAIADTVDYRAVVERVIELGKRSRFHLIERLGGYVGERLLAEFPKIEAVRVEVEKPGAVRGAARISATVTCRRRGRAGLSRRP